MKVLVIDGQGGGIGRALVERIREAIPEAELIAVGTNALATGAMLRAGARQAATGENAVCVCARNADVIVGSLGIVLADAMLGEITPAMAAAIARARAEKVLIPVQRCGVTVAGVPALAMQALIDDAVSKVVVRSQRAAGNGQ